ncbi:MAG: CoA transferase [Comamonadaceae bacterium]|nr:CoA transferase [Comamonadaceae bacterium]
MDSSKTSADQPLHGVRVLEIGHFIAAPLATQTLLDLGADVIKLETQGGDSARSAGWTADPYGPMFCAYNRGKRSIVLDLKEEGPRLMARKLALSCDVVVSNMRPGSLEKQGLGAEQLRSESPRLIYGRVSGFGNSGPSALRPGFDIAAQAESGMMSLNGEADRDPVRIGFTVVDILAANALTVGVLSSLLRRSTTGKGDTIDISLIDVAVSSLALQWGHYRKTGTHPLRTGNGQPSVAPAADVIPARNGAIVLAAYMQPHFERLCLTLGHPEIAQDARFATNHARVQNRPALLATLGQAMRQFDAEDLVQKLTEGGIVSGVIRSMDEVKPGRAGVSQDLFVDVEANGLSPMSLPGLPFTSEGSRRMGGRLPGLGEHTDEILLELEQALATH